MTQQLICTAEKPMNQFREYFPDSGRVYNVHNPLFQKHTLFHRNLKYDPVTQYIIFKHLNKQNLFELTGISISHKHGPVQQQMLSILIYKS